MKKSTVLLLLLLVLCIAGMIPVTLQILSVKEQVQLTEQLVYGEPSVAEGITVTSHMHYDGYLFWDITHVLGEEPKTEYRFSGSGEQVQGWYRYISDSECIELFNGLDGGWSVSSMSGSISTSVEPTGRTGLLKVYDMLVAETGNGASANRRIFLKDYLEYYPVEVSFEAPNGHGRGNEIWQSAYEEFFKIPVLEQECYDVSLKKNAIGEIVELEGCRVDGDAFTWQTTGVRSETDYFFTFYPYSESGNIRVDTGHIPGGYGIYRQPYSVNEDSELELDASRLELFYSLEQGARSEGDVYLAMSPVGQLIILTEAECCSYLYVVDTKSGERLQQLEIVWPEETKNYVVAEMTEEFLLLHDTNNYFCLIDWNSDRGYEQQFMIQVAEDDLLYSYELFNRHAMDWNGERFACVCYTVDEYKTDRRCDYGLAVYDKTGLIYRGEYSCSLMAREEQMSDVYALNRSCEPRTDVSITVEWPEQ